MPRHIIYLLRFTQVIVYFYAGIAKMNEDWIRGEPIRHWIVSRAQQGYNPNSILSHYTTIFLTSEAGVYFISIGGLLFDLTAGFLLCFPRGFIFNIALINCVFFHLMNKFLMNIGIFPWVMLASTTLFFEPDWVFNIPGVSSLIEPAKEVKFKGKLDFKKKFVLLLFCLFALHQILIPLRHHLYYDNVAWNEMGHRYSWRMKLRDKVCEVDMNLVDPSTGLRYQVDYASYLVGKQARKVKPRPELLIQYAHFIARTYEEESKVYPEVYVDMECSLNYRTKQKMFHPDVDLAQVDPYDWSRFPDIIYPLEPLWSRFPDIIYPLEPLTPEEQNDSILNWEKVVSLISDPLQPANLVFQKENKKNKKNKK
eukprot:CAMPEP_0206196994 /NCGR_PEP_ID=MMETSP0166-20121206/8772_1 /ASSEMBLY_ACC=CAM_ASM_000260 /TAXON_ID=95228 /ORGANISM="Vannella robusta, Strain DIVA3 518/3/11/1/6" /LENGTH=366 /DNA_ID=CAMNT_0053614561 /DNA_START=143 /DNA_END=1240 /DNA_ORIENTATION=-